MKISTKGRYSVTALYELALRYGEGATSLKAISQKQGISESYLEQLMGSLRKAGLVKSIRGAQGGYMLAKPPCSITVGEIITALEGPIALVNCLLDDADKDNQYCDRAGSCVTRGVWAKVCDSITKVLESITLKDLCEDNSQEPDVGWEERIGCGK